MQTFLPYPDFDATARCLDSQRLNKQRVEAYQILCCNLGARWNPATGVHDPAPPPEERGWYNHPAMAMWRGHDHSLVRYFDSCNQIWIARGGKDGLSERFDDLLSYQRIERVVPGDPWWLGFDVLHASHRANLFLKDPEYYETFLDSAMDWVAKYRKYAWPAERNGVRGFVIHPSPDGEIEHGAVFHPFDEFHRVEVADA